MSWYLGIDQSYTGFAMVKYNPETGEVTNSVQGFKGKGITRLETICNWVSQRCLGVEHVCLEGYANGMKFGREQAGELGAITKLALYESLPGDLGYPTICPPTSVKKFATGKGNAKKQEMLLGVYKKWGVEYHNDDLCDAYVLARMAHAMAGLNTDHGPTLLAYEMEVLLKLTAFTERV